MRRRRAIVIHVRPSRAHRITVCIGIQAVAAASMPVPQRQLSPLVTPKYGYAGRQNHAQLLTGLWVAHVDELEAELGAVREGVKR